MAVEAADSFAAPAPPDAVLDATLAEFTRALFRRVDPQDLSSCSPDDLARLGASGYAHLAQPRQTGRPDIRLADHELEANGRRSEITVLEVVNDNMPFLLDSTLAELTDQGYEPRLVAHPILAVARNGAGALLRFAGESAAALPVGAQRESFIHIHLDRIDDTEVRARLIEGLRQVYADVAVAADDRAEMHSRVDEIVRAYRTDPPPLAADTITEALAFLDWIRDEHFIFLGLREYRFPDGDTAADPVAGSGLGLLRHPGVRVLRRGRDLVVMTPEIRAFLGRPEALIIAKANVKSRVHRRVHLDYVGIKLFSDAGRLEGELRLIGLFTASAYATPATAVPYLRLKVARVLARANLDPASHAGRTLAAVLENYPRDELFQVGEDTLYSFAIEIMNLSERPRICALARQDEFDRFTSVLVFVPKDRYDTVVRRRIGEFLAGVYQGRVSAAYPA